jgi:hypothetical protein
VGLGIQVVGERVQMQALEANSWRPLGQGDHGRNPRFLDAELGRLATHAQRCFGIFRQLCRVDSQQDISDLMTAFQHDLLFQRTYKNSNYSYCHCK